LQGPDLSSVFPLLVVGKPLSHRFRCGGGYGDASAAAAGVGRGGHIGVGRCMVNSDGRVRREDREVRPTIQKCILSITHQARLWLLVTVASV
jgi:hypothetical protein